MFAAEISRFSDLFYWAWVDWQGGDISRDVLNILFVVTAVVFNLQIIGVYLSSKNGRMEIARRFGTMILLLAIPFLMVFIGYLVLGQESWILLGFGLVFLYLLLELLLDFILQIDFRQKAHIHIPYIFLFYGVQAVIIAIAFSIDRSAGWLVSSTFWALLAALIYSLWPTKWKIV